MLDFMKVATRSIKGGITEVYPEFMRYRPGTGKPCTDLMVRAGDFYAIWDEDTHLWSTEEEVALYLIDRELDEFVEREGRSGDSFYKVLHMWDTNNGMIDKWLKFVQKQMRNNYHPLDENIIFSNNTRSEEHTSELQSRI